ncbi:glycosyltransferase family 2 protein, partial [Lactococcus laudensis]|nr:glycosyltransferase family 2 protein [Lactococcus laudensis]
MNPLISIIVPIYNVEKYIGSLVNSLVKQTNK